MPVPERTSGFTLLEMMVVLAIMGIVSAAVVLAIPDPRGSLTSEAERFAARAKAAQEGAILGARPLAVRITPAGYGFDRREQAGWQPVVARPFEQQNWTEGTSASGPARIVFDSTGLAEPAALTRQRGAERVTVEFAYDGAIRIRV